jgi:hypothetical protein
VTLNVTMKSQLAKPMSLPTAFRQVENWANGGTWTNVTFAANASNYSTAFQSAQYYLDPLGFVHFRGLILYTGTLASGSTMTTLFTLPLPLAPKLTQIELCLLRISTTTFVQAGILYIQPTGIIAIVNQTGGSTTNPYISISGITFAAGV